LGALEKLPVRAALPKRLKAVAPRTVDEAVDPAEWPIARWVVR
jgi:hypothetical protein